MASWIHLVNKEREEMKLQVLFKCKRGFGFRKFEKPTQYILRMGLVSLSVTLYR